MDIRFSTDLKSADLRISVFYGFEIRGFGYPFFSQFYPVFTDIRGLSRTPLDVTISGLFALNLYYLGLCLDILVGNWLNLV